MNKYLLGAALLAAGVNVAAEVDRTVYFTVLGGVQDFHSGKEDNFPIMSNSLDESEVVGAELGFMFTKNSAFQLSYNKLNPDDAIGFGDEDLVLTSLDYVHYFANDSKGGPFLRLGVGRYTFDSEVAGGGWMESDIGRLGIGFEDELNSVLSWRGELGVIRDDTTKRFDTQLLVGFTFNFGGSDPAPVPVKAVETKTVTKNTRTDSDRDGVFDDVDQCPATAAGVVVDPRGCELDSDGDGVFNSKDACAATPAGAKVDAKGCRLMLDETVRITLNVKFANNSSEIRTSFESEFQQVAEFMKQYPDTKLVVEGHSDSVGKDSYNQWLSEKRAQAVANYLMANYGLSSERVSSVGYGETRPVADNSTADGRAKNRRVEAVIETTVKRAQ